jgi:hypothetical protein
MLRLAFGIIFAFLIGVAFGNIAFHPLLHADDIGSGDLLSFSGSLLGVVLAVVGALFIEAIRREANRRDERRPLKDALSALNRLLLKMRFPPEGDLLASQKTRAVQLLMSLEDVRAVLAVVRDKTSLVSVSASLHLREIDRIIEENSGMIHRETAIVTGNEPTARIMAIYHANTTEFANTLQPLVKTTIDRMR